MRIPPFGRNTIDQGARTDTVSVLMGHCDTRTTETYYARKKLNAAISEARTIWQEEDMVLKPPSAKNLLIDNGKYLSGYA